MTVHIPIPPINLSSEELVDQCIDMNGANGTADQGVEMQWYNGDGQLWKSGEIAKRAQVAYWRMNAQHSTRFIKENNSSALPCAQEDPDHPCSFSDPGDQEMWL